MEKKRSKGVTFWGWIFIIYAAISFLYLINPRQGAVTREAHWLYALVIVVYNNASTLAYLICGIFILKLNDTARKAAIILGIITLISLLFYVKPMIQQLNSIELYSGTDQFVVKTMKPEYQKKALENLEKGRELGSKIVPIIFIVIYVVPMLSFTLVPIYYFTRPKVKEQFKS